MKIAALGGGGFSMEPRNPRLDRWLLSLTNKRRPRVLFVPTASGDSADYIRRFHRAFARHACEHAHLSLFNRSGADLREIVLAHDLVYAGGGSTANLLALWRLHGLDLVLREAWREGVVLCGVSAGAICWFEAGVTDSFGPELQPLRNGLGFLPGSFCPHYDGEAQRRPQFQRFVATGALPPGHAADDGAAILFEETRLADVMTSRPHARAYEVDRAGERVVGSRCAPPSGKEA